MWLIKAALRNPYMVATIVFMILFLGIISLLQIPIDILPVFKSPAVQVITYYQGMPASSIEKTITNRIERWVNQSPGAMLVTSKSVPGVSIVRVYFRDDIDPNGALTMTGQLALGTLPTLPPNTLPPVVLPFDPTATMPLGMLTVSNGTPTHSKWNWFARFHHWFEGYLDRANQAYERQLLVLIRHRYKFLGFVCGLIVLAVILVPYIRREFFPAVDAGQITVYFRAPS